MSDGQGWAPGLLEELGMTSEQLPAISPGATAIGERDGALVSAGTIDVLGEQLVAPCGEVGDVLVMCGTTLLPFVLTDQWIEVDGLWTFPSARAGIMAVGGASNAGGLFIDRVRALVGDTPPEELLLLGPDDLPVWLPYPRGERTPLHDPERRAELLDLHVGHTSAHVLMAAYESAGFVVRHHIDLSGLRADRIVAVGGGTKSAAWMQALADTTGLAVDVAAEPYSAALGAAYHSRVTAGLEADTSQARRWGRVSQRVEPRADYAAAAENRYRRFREPAPTDESHPFDVIKCNVGRWAIDRDVRNSTISRMRFSVTWPACGVRQRSMQAAQEFAEPAGRCARQFQPELQVATEGGSSGAIVEQGVHGTMLSGRREHRCMSAGGHRGIRSMPPEAPRKAFCAYAVTEGS